MAWSLQVKQDLFQTNCFESVFLLWLLAGKAGHFWRHCLDQIPSLLCPKADSKKKATNYFENANLETLGTWWCWMCYLLVLQLSLNLNGIVCFARFVVWDTRQPAVEVIIIIVVIVVGHLRSLQTLGPAMRPCVSIVLQQSRPVVFLPDLVSICRLRLLKRLLSFCTSASCLSMSGQCSWNLLVMVSQLPLVRRRFCSLSVIAALLDLKSAAISCKWKLMNMNYSSESTDISIKTLLKNK